MQPTQLPVSARAAQGCPSGAVLVGGRLGGLGSPWPHPKAGALCCGSQRGHCRSRVPTSQQSGSSRPPARPPPWGIEGLSGDAEVTE